MKKSTQKHLILLGLVVALAGSSLQAAEQAVDKNTQIASSLAKAYCLKFDFPAEKIAELDKAPLIGPISLKRDNRELTVYRWLGGGRGDYIVQVEVDQKDSQVTVFGGYAHRDFGEWVFDTAKAAKD